MTAHKPTEEIVAAAVQIDGLTISFPKPARHSQVLWALCDLVDDSKRGAEVQGFLTSEGRFVTRIEAKLIAHRAGQPILREDPHPTYAFSEDFW